MSLQDIPYKNVWKLNYRDPWSGRARTRSFKGETAEKDARAFESAISEQYEHERRLLASSRRRAAARVSSITVADLLDLYLQSLENVSTRKTTAYHVASILEIFGKRRALRMTLDDID